MARGDTTEEGMRREPGIQHLEAGTLAAAATEVVMATTPGGMSSMEMPPTLCMPTATPMVRVNHHQRQRGVRTQCPTSVLRREHTRRRHDRSAEV